MASLASCSCSETKGLELELLELELLEGTRVDVFFAGLLLPFLKGPGFKLLDLKLEKNLELELELLELELPELELLDLELLKKGKTELLELELELLELIG